MRVSFAELRFFCELRGVDPGRYKPQPQRKKAWITIKGDDEEYINKIRANTPFIANNLQFINVSENGDITVREKYAKGVRLIPNTPPVYAESSKKSTKPSQKTEAYIKELEDIIQTRETCAAEVYQIKPIIRPDSGKSASIVISLLSDIHAEETVKPESVMGLNEYNPEVAKARLESYFINLTKLISHAQKNYNINELVLGCLGDFIGGWIHEELQQTNSMSPLNAVSYVQGIIVSGLKYLQDNLNVDKITFIGVVGNHSRLTKKNQYANATDVNLEHFMYKTIESTCKALNLDKFAFVVPQAEAAIIEVFGKRLFFTHGTNIKFGGGIGGIIVPISRWFANTSKAFKIDFAFLGHFHQSLFTKKFCVNGSVKGVDAYAVGKMLDLEEAQQCMVILNEKRGFTQYSPIFL